MGNLSKEITELEEISTAVGLKPEYVQGGGGNTSVKFKDGQMAIKASGFELKELNATNGYTIVEGKDIAEFFRNTVIDDILAQEKASIAFIQNQIVATNEGKSLRPSMETGFHSLMHTYVVHTHSVYANIINCASEADKLIESCFANTNIQPLLIDYCNPGFELSMKLEAESLSFEKAKGYKPQVIFLKNHGLIVSSDNKEQALELHEKVNEILKNYFSIKDQYPPIILKEIAKEYFESNSDYLTEKLKTYKLSQAFFDRVLFPDQTVFFNNNFNIGTSDVLLNKININTLTNTIQYKTGLKEARTIQETLVAYFFILEQLEKNKLTPNFINQADITRINNMESEQYRKDLLK